MTTTEKEQVPHGSLFGTQPGLPTTYVPLNRDPVWHTLALQIDGYADLQRRSASLGSWKGIGTRDEREATWAEAVAEASRTGDITAAFEPVKRQLEERADAEAMSRLHQSAVSHLANEAEVWVASVETQTAFAALLSAKLSALIEEAREEATLVAGAQSFDDIGADAPRARAFAEMRITADRLQSLLTTGAAVLAPALSRGYLNPGEMDREPWPFVWVLKNYQTAWPTFWRRRRLTIVNRGGDRDLVLPPVAPPWDGLSPLRFLQWALERGIRFDAVSADEAAARSTALDKAAHERRKAEAESRTQSDWTTEGEWTEFRV
jgi:hypothetical protein